MPLPTLTSEQRENALAKAAAARKLRSEFKKQVSTGDLAPKQALHYALSDDVLTKTRVFDFLCALPGIGSVKARSHMEKMRIAENRRLRGLGLRQKEELEQLLSGIPEKKKAAA